MRDNLLLYIQHVAISRQIHVVIICITPGITMPVFYRILCDFILICKLALNPFRFADMYIQDWLIVCCGLNVAHKKTKLLQILVNREEPSGSWHHSPVLHRCRAVQCTCCCTSTAIMVNGTYRRSRQTWCARRDCWRIHLLKKSSSLFTPCNSYYIFYMNGNALQKAKLRTYAYTGWVT